MTLKIGHRQKKKKFAKREVRDRKERRNKEGRKVYGTKGNRQSVHV